MSLHDLDLSSTLGTSRTLQERSISWWLLAAVVSRLHKVTGAQDENHNATKNNALLQ
jgi:hypothetical protein|tara:strand:- start:668 stop:838 length:171 start_codon:yes stop_codon:yes gene_type:complete